MLEYFPERRKSSTDLLPLPKALIMRRSPSPSKRSFSDLLSPFTKKANDDAIFYLERQEPNAKRQAKLFSLNKRKSSLNKCNCEELSQYLKNYDSKEAENEDENEAEDPYTFINELNADISPELFQLTNIDENLNYKNKNEKFLVLCELITSEIIYLKQLYYIISRPMPMLSSIKDEFMGNLDINLVFGNFLEVFRSSVIFWTDYMEEVFQLLTTTKVIPDITHMIEGFININKYLVPYKTYCMNIGSNCEYVSKFEEESETFKIFTEWCRNSDASNRLGLDTFLTLPFQRITRYSLFLERISKESTDEEEIEQIFKAISEVDKFVNGINKKVKVKDLTSKLLFFQNILYGFPNVDEYSKQKFPIPPFPIFNLLCPMQVKSEYEDEVRCLIHQDTLSMKLIHKKTIVVKLLLFTDLLIITKPIKKNQQCRLRLIEQPLTLDQVIICDSKDMSEKPSFYIAQLNQFSCFTNIIKFSIAKSSSQKNSVNLFRKKIELAKVNYETLMFSQNPSSVHINVTNPEEINYFKEEETPMIMLADQVIEQSSSENESDCDLSDITSISTSSTSWTDLEISLNSCIIADPFINYPDHYNTFQGTTHKQSHRLSLQNVSEKISRMKTDTIKSFSGDASAFKHDSLWTLFRRSSLGNAKLNIKLIHDHS